MMMTAFQSFAQIEVGAVVPALVVDIDRLALVKYAGAADDYVKEHWDQAHVLAKGYPDVITHGWLTMAHMCRAVTDWAPGAMATIRSYSVRYRRPLFPGRLTCGGTVQSLDEGLAHLSLWAQDQADQVVATGTLVLARSLRLTKDFPG